MEAMYSQSMRHLFQVGTIKLHHVGDRDKEKGEDREISIIKLHHGVDRDREKREETERKGKRQRVVIEVQSNLRKHGSYAIVKHGRPVSSRHHPAASWSLW